MLNRLQRFPPPANVAPAKTPAIIPAPVAKVAETPQYVIPFTPPRDSVSLRAYYLFLNRGARHGFDLDHWFEAELQLVAEHNAALK